MKTLDTVITNRGSRIKVKWRNSRRNWDGVSKPHDVKQRREGDIIEKVMGQ